MNGSLCALVAAGSAVFASGVAAGGVGAGGVLYDIDFSEPYHTFGAAVVLDNGAAPRESFSGYFLTDPADEPVVDGVFSLRSMTDGVAVFDSGAQALLDIENAEGFAGADFDIYTLEFTASVWETGNLTIFFDSPTINRFFMGTDSPNDGAGVITYNTGPSFGPDLADFTFAELLAVEVVFDTVNQRWKIEIDGEVLHQGSTQNVVGTVNNVRFSTSGPVFLDNIKLTGSYIECGDADLTDDGILDLSDISAFVESFLAGCSE